MHRVPRPLLATPPLPAAPGPQRVTVVPQLPPCLRLDPLLPMAGPGLADRPGSGSLGLEGGIPGDQSPAGGWAAGRAKGLLLRQLSTGPAVSEELLITTAPMCSADLHAHEPLTWPFVQASQPGSSQPVGMGFGPGGDLVSGGPTRSSSPSLRLVPPIFEHIPAQQAQHGGGEGAPPASPPGSALGMGSPGAQLGTAAGPGPTLLPSGLPASALLLQGGRLGGLHGGLPGAGPLANLPVLTFNPLMLPSLGLGLSLPTAAHSAGAVATPAAGGTAGDRLASGGVTPAAGGGSGELQEGGSEPSLAPSAAQPSATTNAGTTGDSGDDSAAAMSAGTAAQGAHSAGLHQTWQPSPSYPPHHSQQVWLAPAGAAAHQGSLTGGEPQHWA